MLPVKPRWKERRGKGVDRPAQGRESRDVEEIFLFQHTA